MEQAAYSSMLGRAKEMELMKSSKVVVKLHHGERHLWSWLGMNSAAGQPGLCKAGPLILSGHGEQ